MEEISNLFHGFAVVLQPFNLLEMLFRRDGPRDMTA